MLDKPQKLIFILCAVCVSGCVSNKHVAYDDPDQPIYSRQADVKTPALTPENMLKFVSYNIEHSKQLDDAIAVLRNKALKDADVLCLQEMDLTGVQKIAAEMGYGYVYYPAVRHAFTHKDFGNAILSQWPLSDSKKYILPVSGLTRMQRIMVSANVQVGNSTIGTYCLHDDVYLSAYKKRDMARFVLKNIADDADYVIVAGDFNTYSRRAQNSVKKEFADKGFTDSTSNVAWTSKHWYLFNKEIKIDHIFSRNMDVIDSGMVPDFSASDHVPIWAQLRIKKTEE